VEAVVEALMGTRPMQPTSVEAGTDEQEHGDDQRRPERRSAAWLIR
jgi:hypothetical protein